MQGIIDAEEYKAGNNVLTGREEIFNKVA